MRDAHPVLDRPAVLFVGAVAVAQQTVAALLAGGTALWSARRGPDAAPARLEPLPDAVRDPRRFQIPSDPRFGLSANRLR